MIKTWKEGVCALLGMLSMVFWFETGKAADVLFAATVFCLLPWGHILELAGRANDEVANWREHLRRQREFADSTTILVKGK